MQFTKPNARPRFSKIDILTITYCLWIVFYMAGGWNRAYQPWRFFPLYLSIMILVWISASMEGIIGQTSSSGFANKHIKSWFLFLRSIYPIFFFGFFYTSLLAVNRILLPDWQDPFFMKLDHALFGYYPSLEWGKQATNPWLQEWFHFAYFAYYPMIFGLPVYLYFKSGNAGWQRAEGEGQSAKGMEQESPFTETIFCLCFVFYLCYFIFSLLPVIGGRFIPEAMELTKQSRGFLFSNIMAMIYRTTQHLGGAFPSSHVAIAVVLTISALRHTRVWGYVFAAVTFFLALATVFCHYHWFVDAISGIATGIMGFFLALKAQKWIKI